jgi:hypothetical protein
MGKRAAWRHVCAPALTIVCFVTATHGATLTINGVANTSTCVWSNADNGNDDEDPYNPASDGVCLSHTMSAVKKHAADYFKIK